MSVISSFLSFLGIPQNQESEAPDIRYAHPSHAPENWKKPQAKTEPGNKGAPMRPVKKASLSSKQMIQTVLKYPQLSKINFDYIKKAGHKGIDTKILNYQILLHIFECPSHAEHAVKLRKIQDHLHNARAELRDAKRIEFRGKQRVWRAKSNHTPSRPLTDREKNFLRYRGINPEGWINIPNTKTAIQWIKKNFDPEADFEPFCCSVLEYIGARNAYQSTKRASGADGGIDGICYFEVNGKREQCVIQAKLYGLHKQVCEETCHHMIGVMDDRDIQYGFIITTGTFSERAKARIQRTNDKGIRNIELIDQKRLAEALLISKDKSHGLGLYKTEKGFVYMNEAMLWQAARRNR